jgi:diguanylate cyclase (GGDEF)-like protein
MGKGATTGLLRRPERQHRGRRHQRANAAHEELRRYRTCATFAAANSLPASRRQGPIGKYRLENSLSNRRGKRLITVSSDRQILIFRIAASLGGVLWLVVCFVYTEARIAGSDAAYLADLKERTAGRVARVAERLEGEFHGMAEFAQAFATEPEAIALLRDHADQTAGLAAMDADHRRVRLAADAGATALGDYYQHIADDTNYNLIFLLDPAGTCIATSNWHDANTILGGSYAERAYFRDAISDGTGQQFAVGHLVAVPAFFFASAVRADGVTLGAAVVRKTADTLVATVTSSGALTLVVDASGVVVASNRADLVLSHAGFLGHDEAPRNAGLYGPAPLKELDIVPDGQEGGVVRLNGIAYVPGSRTLAHSPFSIWVAAPVEGRDEVHRALTEAAVAVAVAGLLVLLFLDRMLAYVVARRVHEAALTAANQALTLANLRLSDMALTDPLTGVSNRRHFIERARESLALARRSGQPRTLIILDLDNFKRVNDVHGHPVGDTVLSRTAKACLELTRTTDVFGRIGGEEFALLLWDTGDAGAKVLAERLRAAIEQMEIVHGSATIRITASLGLARLLPREEFESLYTRADAALYAAKEGGRNRFAVAPAEPVASGAVAG